ncbi:MAG: DNA repair protein RecN [Bacteroidales bacterium]|nr:DNA repair protein RecN [Bacteroidales bacterium]
MLKSLKIQNYVLIENLEIDFSVGLSTITGETGAGKSVLIGALSLILGNRADSDSIFNKEKKCVVEGFFDISNLGLEALFIANDWDFDNYTILRREIAENGKSRAFINDSPVSLKELKDLANQLIDIHSQHQNLDLGSHLFQLKLLDSYANNLKLVKEYRGKFIEFQKLITEIKILKEKQAKQIADKDYFSFQLEQLEQAGLVENEQEELENEQEVLSNAEEILSVLKSVSDELVQEENNLVDRFKSIKNRVQKISNVYKPAGEFLERLDSLLIETKDLGFEVETAGSSIEINPGRLDEVNQRLDNIYTLCKKHNVNGVNELIEVRNNLEAGLLKTNLDDSNLEALIKNSESKEKELKELANNLSKRRKTVIPELEKTITGYLQSLAIKNAVFKIDLSVETNLNSNGINTANFLFSANQSVAPQEISKVASGGEIARLMLSIKLILAKSLQMPTVIFDEIDTGVSGEIGDKMGKMMKEMSLGNQVIAITHLPQIASRGDSHYLVYKVEKENKSQTLIKLLNYDERLFEIAKMLSGEKTSDAAIENAKVLLAQKN